MNHVFWLRVLLHLPIRAKLKIIYDSQERNTAIRPMKIRTYSIKRKFFLILVCFTIIPAILLSFWIYTRVSNNWREKEYSSQSNELGNILKTTELQLNNCASHSRYFSDVLDAQFF